jgi:hypothetical protein
MLQAEPGSYPTDNGCLCGHASSALYFRCGNCGRVVARPLDRTPIAEASPDRMSLCLCVCFKAVLYSSSYESSVETSIQASELWDFKPERIVIWESCLLHCKETLTEYERNVAVGILGIKGASGRFWREISSDEHWRASTPDGEKGFDALVCVAFYVCGRLGFDDVDVGQVQPFELLSE